MMSLKGWANGIHIWARDNGFYDHERGNPSIVSEKLMLIVSEVAETQDALRSGDRVHEAEEVADILIRTLDYAAWRGIDLDVEVEAKMAKNLARPRMHGRQF